MKNRTTAILLAAFFGPLGVCYVSVGWALLFFIASPIIFFGCLAVWGASPLGWVAAIGIPWFMGMGLAGSRADAHNERLKSMLREASAGPIAQAPGGAQTEALSRGSPPAEASSGIPAVLPVALAGGLLLGGLVAFFAPVVIHWYAQPPFAMGCDCGQAMTWAMGKLVLVLAGGTVLGGIAGGGLFLALTSVRRGHETAGHATEDARTVRS